MHTTVARTNSKYNTVQKRGVAAFGLGKDGLPELVAESKLSKGGREGGREKLLFLKAWDVSNS